MPIELLKPELATPFPRNVEFWTCPDTGFKVPKYETANIEWRGKLMRAAETDMGLRRDLMSGCKESLKFFINFAVWTFHQMDVSSGERIGSEHVHVPFITWDVQDGLLDEFLKCVGLTSGGKTSDILIDKSRDMGASWCCIAFIHWLWLFRDGAQLLELSRTEDYVDKAGDMKALFQRHDYINQWLPHWMRPPDCLYRQKERTNKHMRNILNGACIDGESTTEHAASGDRRLVILLDEFAKVKNGALMRSATRDAGLVRIINSTGAGPGTEYSKWKRSGQIKVFPLMWWDHPDKGRGRYVEQDEITGAWKIKSPWYNAETKVRSPKEMAREVDAIDMEAGSLRMTIENIDKHIALFGRESSSRWDIKFKKEVTEESIRHILTRRNVHKVRAACVPKGDLRIWVDLVNGRLDQTKDYICGIDISKGQGASNSVISIKCRQTGEKVGEWRNAETPPYEMASIAAAIAIWVGGRRGLPFLKWEKNGPGWDFGRQMVKVYYYPFYYKTRRIGKKSEKKTDNYGWQSSQDNKDLLIDEYDRALAHGKIINHSIWALEEAKQYVYYDGGGCGPADLVEENASARKTHGDCVIADALTIENEGRPGKLEKDDRPATTRSAWYRKKQMKERKERGKVVDLGR